MASLDDILTTQKNGVIGINNIAVSVARILTTLDDALEGLYPHKVSPTVTDTNPYLVITGPGTLFSVSITAYTGTGTVSVYNSATTGGAASSNCIYKSMPANATYFQPYHTVSLAFTDGLVIQANDAGMEFCVSYNTEES